MLSPANQQAAPGQLHPFVEEVVTHASGNSTTHNVVMPAEVAAGDLLAAFFCISEDNIELAVPAGWVEQNTSDSTGHTWGLMLKNAAGTEGGTTVNFVTDSSVKIAMHVFQISSWAGGAFSTANIAYENANEVFLSPENQAAWGSFANLWIECLATSMSGTYVSHPAGFSDLIEVSTGTTATDAQMYTCRVLNVASSMSGNSWSFSSPSGNWSAMQLAVKGSTVV